MKNGLSQQQITQYRDHGFLVIENFLSPDELAFWRMALDAAVAKWNGNKIPDRTYTVLLGERIVKKEKSDSDGGISINRAKASTSENISVIHAN